jgi:hypothetical protein
MSYVHLETNVIKIIFSKIYTYISFLINYIIFYFLYYKEITIMTKIIFTV